MYVHFDTVSDTVHWWICMIIRKFTMLVPGCQAGKLVGDNLPASVRPVPVRQMMKMHLFDGKVAWLNWTEIKVLKVK